VRALSPIEHHSCYCNTASLFGRENLLCSSKLSFLGRLSDTLRIATGNGGQYFNGTLFLARFNSCGLAFLPKEVHPSLQEMVDLSLLTELMKGLPQLSALDICVPVLFMKLTTLPRIVRFWCRVHRLWPLQHWVLLHLYEYAPGVSGEAGSMTSSLDLLSSHLALLSTGTLAFLWASVLSV